MRARISVKLKSGVLDPQGKAIEAALHRLGFEKAHDVRQGKLIEVDVDADSPEQARELAEEMCRKLLANPVMESYSVEVDTA
jgi:phosphoribosylformylglycinamidine synthase